MLDSLKLLPILTSKEVRSVSGMGGSISKDKSRKRDHSTHSDNSSKKDTSQYNDTHGGRPIN